MPIGQGTDLPAQIPSYPVVSDPMGGVAGSKANRSGKPKAQPKVARTETLVRQALSQLS